MSRVTTTREHVVPARGCNRRAFLRSVLAGAIAAALPAADPGIVNAGSDAGDWLPWLGGITGKHEAVVRLGKAYLAAHPGEQDPAFLVVAIERAAATRLGTDTVAGLEPQQVVVALQHVVRSEYIRGDVVSVDRWVLSTTEARSYGLVASLSG